VTVNSFSPVKSLSEPTSTMPTVSETWATLWISNPSIFKDKREKNKHHRSVRIRFTRLRLSSEI